MKRYMAVIVAAVVMCTAFIALCNAAFYVVVMSEADFADGSHVYVLNADGSGFAMLDDVDSSDFFRSEFYISGATTDRTKLAFGHYGHGPIRENSLYTVNADGSDFIKIATYEDAYYRFSLDFSKIICFDQDSMSIYIMNGDGSGKTEIAGGYEDREAFMLCRWSSDGSKIAYSDNTAKAMYIIDTGSNTRTKISDHAGEVESLGWLDDFSQLYYLEAGRLYLINSDGTGKQTFAEYNIDDLEVSPDRSRVIYWTDNSICVMNVDGSRKTELFGNIALSRLSWSPDGSKIAYLDHNVYLMNADGGSRTKLTDYGEYPYVERYVWSSDSQRLFFQAAGNIYVVGADGSGLKKLTDYEVVDYRFASTSGIVGSFTISPDGKQIAYIVYMGSGDEPGPVALDVYVMNADGSSARVLASAGVAQCNYLYWSPDSSKLLFIANKRNLWQEE